MLQLIRKPPVGIPRSERLKITLAGNHTLKQKTCMLLQVKFWLGHEEGIANAGPCDVYLSLIDPNGYPLTTFRDGKSVADYTLLIDSPYHSAADEYENRHPPPPAPRPF